MVTGDFDDDGFDDLALTTLAVDVGDHDDDSSLPSEVRIIYGSASGLTRAGSNVIPASVLTGQVPGDDGSFGSTLVAAEFGRGPQEDLAIGASSWRGFRGAVTVLYGSAAGLDSAGAQTWTQDVVGVPGTGAEWDEFGHALAAGPLDGGRYASLAIGVPGDGSTGGPGGTGAVNVLYGSAAGLTTIGADLWTRASPGIKGRAERYGGFGRDLAVGHFAGRPAADLVITGSNDRGDTIDTTINVLRGSSTGLTARGDQLWSVRSRGLNGRKYLDSFGAVMVGSFGRDRGTKHFDDLVVSATTEREKNDSPDTGAVLVLYGTSKGLKARHSQVWRLDSPGVKGNQTRIDVDGYGEGLTRGDYGKSGYDDLAVGEGLMELKGDRYGAVSVLYGTARGLTAKGDQLWTVAGLGRTVPDFWMENIATS